MIPIQYLMNVEFHYSIKNTAQENSIHIHFYIYKKMKLNNANKNWMLLAEKIRIYKKVQMPWCETCALFQMKKEFFSTTLKHVYLYRNHLTLMPTYKHTFSLPSICHHIKCWLYFVPKVWTQKYCLNMVMRIHNSRQAWLPLYLNVWVPNTNIYSCFLYTHLYTFKGVQDKLFTFPFEYFLPSSTFSHFS